MPERFPEQPDTARLDALVLAGRRGDLDALADEAGATHRALIEVGGVPMIERVIATLREVPRVDRIFVSIDRADLARQEPGIAALEAAGTITLISAARSPSRSVLEAAERLGGRPLLLTTADHPLLTPEMVEHFLRRATQGDPDLAVGVVAESVVRARFPTSRRTYLPLREEGYSGANLFLFRTPAGLKAAEFWQRAEQMRKRPWRLAAAFGLGPLWLFLSRRLDLSQATTRASRTIGARIEAIPLPFAEAAVDVDRIADLKLVRELLAVEVGFTHG